MALLWLHSFRFFTDNYCSSVEESRYSSWGRNAYQPIVDKQQRRICFIIREKDMVNFAFVGFKVLKMIYVADICAVNVAVLNINMYCKESS
jgi:hypothetical protein